VHGRANVSTALAEISIRPRLARDRRGPGKELLKPGPAAGEVGRNNQTARSLGEPALRFRRASPGHGRRNRALYGTRGATGQFQALKPTR